MLTKSLRNHLHKLPACISLAWLLTPLQIKACTSNTACQSMTEAPFLTAVPAEQGNEEDNEQGTRHEGAIQSCAFVCQPH